MNPYLTNVLDHGPLILERIFNLIPESKWDEHKDPERFSLREEIAHLADWEPILRGRMEAVERQPGYQIQGIDEGERAIEQSYHSQDPRRNLEMFKAERSKTVWFLGNLTKESWSKTSLHKERGEMTIEAMANMLLGHDLYHIEHATQYL